jgi:hypothetical protein
MNPPNAWRSVLYSDEWNPALKKFETDKLIQDFSYAGYRRGEVPLPQITGPIFDVAATYNADPKGVLDSTVAIQSAIDAASKNGGGVVYLPAGTYRIKPQGDKPYSLRISSSNIVLRGAGKDKTFLFNDDYKMRRKHIISVQSNGPEGNANWGTKPEGSPEVLITHDLLSPTTTVHVADVAGFAVGDWITLRADASDEFIAEHNMTDLWGGKGAGLGGVMFHRQITAISSTEKTLTIDVPIRYYLKMRDEARVHQAVPHLEEIGLEDFSIGNREHPGATGWEHEDYRTGETKSAYEVHLAYAIVFRMARNCWVRDVASYRPAVNTTKTHILSDGIGLNSCRGVTLRNCDFQWPQFGGGGGNGYMYRLTNAQESLLENCAARYNRHGFVFSHMSTSGNVIHGGIGQFTNKQAGGKGTTGGKGSDHHQHFSQSNLIDSVTVQDDFFIAAYRGTLGGNPPHGQTSAHTVFWNIEGLAYSSPQEYAVHSEQARFGYVIGTRGPAPAISLGENPRTAPIDHAEGEGKGDSLIPSSLYLDQKKRRLTK